MKILDLIRIARIRHLIIGILQMSVGAVIASKYMPFNASFFLGALSFAITYAGVYIFNDINDATNDKNHEIKWKQNRPLARGTVPTSLARKIMIAYLIIGLSISIFVNNLFAITLGTITAINLMYTGFNLKNKIITGMNLLLIIHTLKTFLGLTAISSSLNNAPIIPIIAYGLSYSFAVSVYKRKKFKNKRQLKVYLTTVGLTIISLFVISLVIYEQLRLGMFMSGVMAALCMIPLLKVNKNLKDEFQKTLLINTILYSIIIACLAFF
ncbi:MAG TPA: UbiA family prenyltransferase [Candidatus Nanoarchaeia archaeon]|nr:UbiA family prenyltransferase [Candidatus Nanoarchaeia archaeon]